MHIVHVEKGEGRGGINAACNTCVSLCCPLCALHVYFFSLCVRMLDHYVTDHKQNAISSIGVDSFL